MEDPARIDESGVLNMGIKTKMKDEIDEMRQYLNRGLPSVASGTPDYECRILMTPKPRPRRPPISTATGHCNPLLDARSGTYSSCMDQGLHFISVELCFVNGRSVCMTHV